jgi:hypothetical protein
MCLRLYVRAGAEQVLDDGKMSSLRCLDQGRLAVRVWCVRVGPSLHQRLHSGAVALRCRCHEHGTPEGILRVHIGACGDQDGDNIVVALHDRLGQGGCAPPGTRIHIRAAGQQATYRHDVATLGSTDQGKAQVFTFNGDGVYLHTAAGKA